jgi:hypothetical protein
MLSLMQAIVCAKVDSGCQVYNGIYISMLSSFTTINIEFIQLSQGSSSST